MVIDMILDRKEGTPYNKEFFRDYVAAEEEFFTLPPISYCMDHFNNETVQEALCDYIISFGYPERICDYVKSVNWL